MTKDDEALAFDDVRLSERGGAHDVKLVPLKGSGLKNVTVSFSVAIA